MPGATRIERDSFGGIAVPAERLWGAQTQRSLAMFSISGERMPHELILALAQVKRAAAVVNRQLGALPDEQAQAIIRAADEIIAGQHADEFPLMVWQTGSGTQTNMNMNEVLANRASELLGGGRGDARLIHPHDAVNLGQSSNDVIPTAMHVAACVGLGRNLLPTLQALHSALADKALQFSTHLKLGRTHLQDATPISLGQEFSGYAAQCRHALTAVTAVIPPLQALAIGGTAVGTGLNTHPEFGHRVAAELAHNLGIAFHRADNLFAALAAHDELVSAHGALKTVAVAAIKIANDLRWLASGPRAGLGEITLPANEPGSSIMAGKVNPTQCEAVIMAAQQVIGNDMTVTLAGASGNFELNVGKPLIAHAFAQSVRLLSDSLSSLDRHCIRGITANAERMGELLQRSLMLATALVPHVGYERTAQIVQHAQTHDLGLREAAIASGLVCGEDFDRWVRPERMIAPQPP